VIRGDNSTMKMMLIDSSMGVVMELVHLMERVGVHKTSYRMEYAAKEQIEIEQMMNLALGDDRQLREIRMSVKSSLEREGHKQA
jgi:hypothetical protein